MASASPPGATGALGSILSDLDLLSTSDYRNPSFWITIASIIGSVYAIVDHKALPTDITTAIVSAGGFITTLYVTLRTHLTHTIVKAKVATIQAHQVHAKLP
ncbi:MAG: hypothetical protein ACREBW_06500 [Candidatus Micrarchaeaceae archaeon]